MAINWDLYNKRLNVNGSSERERNIKSIQSQIVNHLPHSPSYKDVSINGTNRNIAVIKTTYGYKKTILSLPSETFDIGDYVVFESKTYLVTEIDDDKEVYTSGKMQLCNYTLKWQDSTGAILLSVGLDEGNVITTPNSTHKIKLPFDSNTVLLNTDKRFIIDDSTVEIPQVFAISNPNRTEFKYGDKGIIELTMKADNYNALTDNIALGVCNYFSPTTPPEPSPINYTMTITHDMDLIVNNTLWCTFTPILKDENGSVVTSWTANWSFNYNGMDESKFIIEYDGNDCKVKVVDESYDVVDNVLGLTCTSDNGTIGNYNI
ncbi:MAG: hypothetical protein K0R54_4790, partial [Clostridiaceae bacterium]|nr:hypothetical protein [Clostridiaceae bacterium]